VITNDFTVDGQCTRQLTGMALQPLCQHSGKA
jgi:hypothetical protein